MKCPKCLNNQKYKDGMTCHRCHRRFVLNPKTTIFSDIAIHKSIRQVSGAGHYYFTYNQLFSQIFRLARKKMRTFRIALFSVLFFFVIWGLFLVSFPVGPLFALTLFFIIVPIKIGIGTGKIANVAGYLDHRHGKIGNIINTYHRVHPIEKMVDGKRFKSSELHTPDDETKEYAPERILIVEHNDLADMLIMNRFHLENKTLVVSAEKYPRNIFDACQTFLHNHPDLPVCLLHDASKKGGQMREKLLADSTWNLKSAKIKDIGLFPHDTDRLKPPMWLPSGSKGDKILLTKKSDEHIRNGYRMPVDIAQPKPLMGALGLAAVSGMALLSSELLAELQQDATGAGGMGGWGGGFG
ncbi:hypothetical protein QUF90_25880 [Desulfococcaceae bacterium HSG9]|nr:hypothetical protein [Desulfococcaceae bacterium HSG9]